MYLFLSGGSLLCNSVLVSAIHQCKSGLGTHMSPPSGWVFKLVKAPRKKYAAAAAAKSLQSCPTLCDPIDGSPPGSPVPGILQARTLEWVAISFSNAWKGKVKVKSLSRVRLLATPWTAAHQAPPSMGFSRREYCSGVPLPSPKKEVYKEVINNQSWVIVPGDTRFQSAWVFSLVDNEH